MSELPLAGPVDVQHLAQSCAWLVRARPAAVLADTLGPTGAPPAGCLQWLPGTDGTSCDHLVVVLQVARVMALAAAAQPGCVASARYEVHELACALAYLLPVVRPRELATAVLGGDGDQGPLLVCAVAALGWLSAGPVSWQPYTGRAVLALDVAAVGGESAVPAPLAWLAPGPAADLEHFHHALLPCPRVAGRGASAVATLVAHYSQAHAREAARLQAWGLPVPAWVGDPLRIRQAAEHDAPIAAGDPALLALLWRCEQRLAEGWPGLWALVEALGVPLPRREALLLQVALLLDVRARRRAEEAPAWWRDRGPLQDLLATAAAAATPFGAAETAPPAATDAEPDPGIERGSAVAGMNPF
jgi:hypothetical protein